MATEKPATMEFVCARCEARLNVKALLAGKKINCPKCHKKIVVPLENREVAGIPAKPAINPAAPAAGERAPASGSEDKNGRRLADIETELQQKQDRLAQRDRELEKLREELQQQRSRHTELNADLEKARAERLELREKAEAQQAKDEEKGSVEAGLQAEEMERAKQRIADLERQVEEARREADMARARAAAGAIFGGEDESRNEGYEGPDPDRLIADLQGSTLRRGLRISLVAHAVLLVFTSLGFIYWSLRGGRPQPQTADATETPAAAQQRAEPAETPPPAGEPVVETEETPSEEDRPLTEIERRIEALPEPGEVPTPSEITLDLD